MNFKIELANETHLTKIFEAEKICFPNEFWSLNSIKSELDNDRNICIIAQDNEKLLGYLFLSTVCDECELERIAVLPKYRKQKIAATLMKEMKAVLNAKRFKTIFLEVRCGNISAINLYFKNGFEKIGLRKNYYKNPTEDAVLMSLKLS